MVEKVNTTIESNKKGFIRFMRDNGELKPLIVSTGISLLGFASFATAMNAWEKLREGNIF